LQYGFDQEGGRAFSIGTRNSNIRNSLARSFVEIGAQAGERTAPVHNLRPRNRGTRHFGCGIGDDCNRSGSDGLVNEPIAVTRLTLHGNENSSGAHPPGIVFHASNGRVSALGEDLGTLQKLLECHCSDYK
jgi:hypothetical protein